MSQKGDKTKQEIRENAYRLFARKGFKAVTMKDICELTGLSRGGLYRHYESTGQIFLELVNSFCDRQRDEVFAKIKQHISAAAILEELLAKYESEMLDAEHSLSLAICEFYSDPAIPKEGSSVEKQYEASKAAWVELINYGISTNEFQRVNPESVFHVIVFAYQGVRLYSKMMNMEPEIPTQIINQVKRLLLPQEALHG